MVSFKERGGFGERIALFYLVTVRVTVSEWDRDPLVPVTVIE